MSNFWIVSSHEFKAHKTPDSALAEAARLMKLTGHAFHVYGVGEKLGPSTVPPEGAAAGAESPHAYLRSSYRAGCAVCGKAKADPIHIGAEPVPARERVTEVEPHDYVPSAQHMGDCAVCGHLQGDPIHKRGRPMIDIIGKLLADRRIDAAFRFGLAIATGRAIPNQPAPAPMPERQRMKVYSGRRDQNGATMVRVTRDGDSHVLRPRTDLANHSPTGFEWGYAGSGPAQLALAILADALGDDQAALRLHQRFKFKVIGALKRDSPWLLSEKQVLAAVKDIITRGDEPC